MTDPGRGCDVSSKPNEMDSIFIAIALDHIDIGMPAEASPYSIAMTSIIYRLDHEPHREIHHDQVSDRSLKTYRGFRVPGVHMFSSTLYFTVGCPGQTHSSLRYRRLYLALCMSNRLHGSTCAIFDGWNRRKEAQQPEGPSDLGLMDGEYK